MLKKFWCSGVFRDVPGVFRGVPGVFRGVPGFTDTQRNCHVCNWNKCFTVQNNMNPRFQV